MKGTLAKNSLSEGPQDSAGNVAEGEEASMYENVHNRYDDLPNDNGEPVDE